MTAKDQAIAQAFNTWADRRRNWTDTLRAEAWAAFQEGYWSAQPPAPDCRPPAQPATPEDMVIYKAIADNYQNSLKPPAPDCRTCAREHGCYAYRVFDDCTNGDKYQPAPKVVLWRTE